MLPHLQATIITIAVAIAGVTFELIRRNRLKEEYSFLWFALSAVMFTMALWHGSLAFLSRVIGTVYPPSALFMAAVLLLLALTMHYSMVVSRLSDETRMLAQEAARLKAQIDELAGRLATKN